MSHPPKKKDGTLRGSPWQGSGKGEINHGTHYKSAQRDGGHCPRGVGKNGRLWRTCLKAKRELNGFAEVRTPVFEHTELFLRGVGDTTDVVEKQMYTFEDKGGRSITLRPEGTAGAVRAMLENGLYNAGYPVKLYYLTSCYRYEKPQAGRLRELHQFGVEMFGAAEPVADAQIIAMALSAFKRLAWRTWGCS